MPDCMKPRTSEDGADPQGPHQTSQQKPWPQRKTEEMRRDRADLPKRPKNQLQKVKPKSTFLRKIAKTRTGQGRQSAKRSDPLAEIEGQDGLKPLGLRLARNPGSQSKKRRTPFLDEEP